MRKNIILLILLSSTLLLVYHNGSINININYVSNNVKEKKDAGYIKRVINIKDEKHNKIYYIKSGKPMIEIHCEMPNVQIDKSKKYSLILVDPIGEIKNRNPRIIEKPSLQN